MNDSMLDDSEKDLIFKVMRGIENIDVQKKAIKCLAQALHVQEIVVEEAIKKASQSQPSLVE